MNLGWDQIWGFGVVIVGCVMIFSRNIPIGIEGRHPSFYVKGKLAVFIGVLVIAVGLIVTFDIPRQMRIDSCLDSGGKYDYIGDNCLK